MKKHFLTHFLSLPLCFVSNTIYAQLELCTGNSGDPIFMNPNWITLFFNAHQPFEK